MIPAWLLAYWWVLIAYPAVGAFLYGMMEDDRGRWVDLLFVCLIWPLLLVMAVGAIVKGLFRG